MKNNDTAIVIPDIHAPLHDEAALRCVLRAIHDIQPSHVIVLGDAGEWDSVNHWQYKRKKRPPIEYILPKLEQDAEEVKKVLTMISEACKESKRVFITGNHEQWVNNFVDDYPFLQKEYSLPKLLGLRDLGYRTIPETDYFKLHDMYFHHGHAYGGVNHGRNYQLKLNADICYGHFHTPMVYTGSSIDGGHTSYCLGALKKVDKVTNKWVKGRIITWHHNFAIIYWRDGKRFVNMVPIENGTMMLNGEYVSC